MNMISEVMTHDPNKQTFPLISGAAPQHAQEDTLTSPSREMESLTSNSKTSVELPLLVASRDELAPACGRDQDYALKPRLPLVKRGQYSRSGPKPDPDRDELAERFQTKDSLPYQASNFRSSTVMRSVSIQKKKDQSGLAVKSFSTSLMKKRVVPVHTKPFIWSHEQPQELSTEGQSLAEKFLAEEERLNQIRGQKRRMMQPVHRKKYNDLHIGGSAPTFTHKLDYGDERDKIKNAVLPKEAQEIYLGRGFMMPDSHGTAVRRKMWQEKVKMEASLPSSAPVTTGQSGVPPSDSESRRQTAPAGAKHRTDRHHESEPQHVPLSVHRTPTKPKINRRPSRHDDSGVSTAEGSIHRPNRTERKPHEGQRSNNRRVSEDAQKGERAKKNGSQEKKESYANKESTQEHHPAPTVPHEESRQDESKKEEKEEEKEEEAPDMETDDQQEELTRGQEETEIVFEHIEDEMSLPRPDSALAMDVDDPLDSPALVRPPTHLTPTPKPPSPNPLMSADLHLNITPEKRDQLALRFTKLDSDKDGHITFKELETSFPQNLSRAQQRYIKEAYDLVSASTFFGLEEFVTISCLCDRLAALTGPLRDAYEKINTSSLQQDITQFVVLFSTVDRRQTGCINLDSFKELLAMALNKDLASSTRLFNDILSGIGKVGSESIDKVEYLVFIPYFLGFR